MTRFTALRRALIATSAVAVLPLAAAPAVAADLTVEDARKDVYTIQIVGEGPEEEVRWVKDPSIRQGDVVRTTYRHTDKRVSIRTKFVELERGAQLRMYGRMRAQDGKKYSFQLVSTKRNPAGRASLRSYRGDKLLDCAVKARVDFAKNTAMLSFPRTCVNNPRALEFTIMSIGGTRRNPGFDNAQSESFRPFGWTSKVRSS